MNLIFLAKKLKQIRIKKEKSLSDVASAIHIDRTYLSKIESGKRKPSQTILNELLNYYSIPMEQYSSFFFLAGLPSVATSVNETNLDESIFEKREVMKLENNSKVAQTQPNILVPNNVQVLYTDTAYITASPFGLVFDFAQRVGPTQDQNVVARIGMSKEHAKALLQVLANKIVEADLGNKKEKSD